MNTRKPILVFALLLSTFCLAQNPGKMLQYDFIAALSEYRDSLEHCTDSVRAASFQEACRHAENAITMTEYCKKPNIVARKRFSFKDYFLYYPLPDQSWRITDSTILYHPGVTVDTIRLAARDSVEYLPMVCGKDRYFASRDLFGMGGYDLYVCHWDDTKGDWGEPENLGFPYSSPYDDFLFCNTDDGRYSIFASNRDCPSDSVYVYVLEYESVPVSSAISDPEKLRELASLDPGAADKKEKEEIDASAKLYIEKVTRVRELRDSVSAVSKGLDVLREEWTAATDEKKKEIADKLTDGENILAQKRLSLEKASRELNEVEMNFLLNGVSLDISKLARLADEDADETIRFRFRKHNPGPPVNYKYL